MIFHLFDKIPNTNPTSHPKMEVKRQTAKTLISRLDSDSDSDQTRISALCELRLLSKSDPEIRPILASSGAIPFLISSLYSSTPLPLSNAAAALLNLSISARESVASSPGVLDALSHVLRHHSSAPSAAGSAAATLFSLLIDESHRKTVGSRRDILSSLIDIIKNPNPQIRSTRDALNALFGVALYPPNRGVLIDLGAVPVLFSLIGRSEVVDEATAVIGLLAGCESALEAFRRVEGVGVLVELIEPAMGASRRARGNAVSGMLNLVKVSGDGVKEEMRRIGGEARVLEAVMDLVENGSPKGKNKAEALVRAIGYGGGFWGVGGVSVWSRDSSARVSDSVTTDGSY